MKRKLINKVLRTSLKGSGKLNRLRMRNSTPPHTPKCQSCFSNNSCGENQPKRQEIVGFRRNWALTSSARSQEWFSGSLEHRKTKKSNVWFTGQPDSTRFNLRKPVFLGFSLLFFGKLGKTCKHPVTSFFAFLCF